MRRILTILFFVPCIGMCGLFGVSKVVARLDDGGFILYFAEPSFFLPTDFFYVWNPSAKRWDLREASELP